MVALFRHRSRSVAEGRGPTPDHVAEAEAEVRAAADGLIVGGFRTVRAVAEAIAELDPVADGVIAPDRVAELISEQWTARLDRLSEPNGREPSDDERVQQAFLALRRVGVLASMNLGRDHREAAELSKQLANEEPDARGYVYFDERVAARLGEPGAILHLGYGPIGTLGTSDEYEAATLLIASMTRDALEDEGLTVEWNGSTGRPLALLDLDWRRPLPEEPTPPSEPNPPARKSPLHEQWGRGTTSRVRPGGAAGECPRR